jgi:hypothetical protein
MWDQTFEWIFDKLHGVGFAAAVLTALVAVATVREDPLKETMLTFGIWAGTLGFYWLGGRLDKILYNPIFGTKGIARKILDPKRTAVREKFAQLRWSTEEIQQASRSLFEQSSEWEKRVEPAYSISKASRSFIIPLLLIFIYEIAGWPWGNITSEFRNGILEVLQSSWQGL